MNAKTKKALILSVSDPSGSPRPNRAVSLLHHMGFEIFLLSPIPASSLGIEFTKVFPVLSTNPSLLGRAKQKIWYLLVRLSILFRLSGQWREFLWYRYYNIHVHFDQLKQLPLDLILVEDIYFLSYGVRVSGGEIPVLFDAREFFPKEFEKSLVFKYSMAPEHNRILNTYLPKIKTLYTVSSGLAEAYQNGFGIKTYVVRSAPFFVDLNPSFQVGSPVRMIHHGVANTDRGLDKMVEVIKSLNGAYTLDFYLVGRPSRISRLKQLAKDNPWISFKKPVPFKELIENAAQYDMGFYLLQPKGFNTRFALPNKFFEFIQARLALAIGPSPEMKRIALEYDVAVISESFDVVSMTDALSKLTKERILEMKQNTSRAARELCWEQESLILRDLFNQAVI